MDEAFQIKILQKQHFHKLDDFCHHYVGEGYFDENKLNQFCTNSVSLGVFDQQDNIAGARLTSMPEEWYPYYQDFPLYKSKWNVAPERMALFKVIWLKDEAKGFALGHQMSTQAISLLKETSRIDGILTHAWKESPKNGSVRYLTKLGFETLGVHQLFWNHVDVFCHACKEPKCICNAVEMIYRFDS